MAGPILSDRALNRALLARQSLLERGTNSTVETVRHLVGMQGQAPLAPYVGLWSRLRAFAPDDLSRAIEDRTLVRTTLMRGTVHLVTADDALRLRPLTEPAIIRGFRGGFRSMITAEQEAEVTQWGRELLAERPRTRVELRGLFRERWPEIDADAMAYAVSYLLPTVQPTPRGLWGVSQGAAQLALLEAWVGSPLDPEPSVDVVLLRYLAAFGPGSVNDAQAWSGLTGLREVFDRLAPELMTFASEKGQLLYDLPDAPRPAADHPAPPRLLPEYDNVLLSHRDRGRIIDSAQRVPLPPGTGARSGTFLSDGYFRGTWTIEADAVRIRPHGDLGDDVPALVAEGRSLAAFLGASDAEIASVTRNSTTSRA